MLLGYCTLCLIYGTTFLAIKVGINVGFAPFMFAGLRFVIAGTLLLAYLLVRKVPLPVRRADLGLTALVGLCMTTTKFAALYWATQYLPTGSAALLVATLPIMVTIAAFLLDGQRWTRLQGVGLAIGFGGVALLIGPKVSGQVSGPWLLGALVIMIGELVNAFGVILSRRAMARGLAPVLLNSLQMLFGSIGLLLISFLSESSPFPTVNWAAGAGALVYLILAGSVVGAGIYYWLVKMTNPLIPSTWTYVSPVIALLVGFVFLRETLSPLDLIGSGVVLGGVFLTNYQVLRGVLRGTKTERAA